MLILDFLLIVLDFTLAGNSFGQFFRKEKGWKTAVSGVIYLLLGIYFTLALIGTTAEVALINP